MQATEAPNRRPCRANPSSIGAVQQQAEGWSQGEHHEQVRDVVVEAEVAQGGFHEPGRAHQTSQHEQQAEGWG
jgi:hypothetical protein